MDLIFEFVFELILEGIFGLTIKNPKIRTRVKTTIFVVMTQLLAAFLGFLALTIPSQDGSTSGNLLCGIAAIMLSAAFLLTAVHGHRNDWKQD